MTKAITYCFFGCLLGFGSSQVAHAQDEKPPVILIVLDDLFDVVDQQSRHGVDLHVPNFDRLATKGVRFSNAFASVAVCNPSRSSFMTGQSPFRTTIHVPEPVQWNEVLTPESTFVAPMRNAGYEALSCGKVFHNQARLEEQEFFAGIFDQNFQFERRLALPAGEIAFASELPLADDMHVAWAVEQISNYKRPSTDSDHSPMFLSVGIIRPHAPFIVPQRFFDLYPQDQLVAGGDFVAREADLMDVSDFYKKFRLLNNYHNNLFSKGQAVEFAQGYLASLSYADELLGKLLNAIEANEELADATIIVASDNGYQLGEKLTWNKFTLWEETAKVPLYIINPQVTPGSTCDIPVSLLDLAPTITNLGNAAQSPLFDGEDLLEILNTPEEYADRAVVTSMIGSLSIRNKQYRLILYNDGSKELYNIVVDPQESINLAGNHEYQGVISELLTQLTSLTIQQGATTALSSLVVQGTDQNDTLFVDRRTDGSRRCR